jgi:hypothetical protein
MLEYERVNRSIADGDRKALLGIAFLMVLVAVACGLLFLLLPGVVKMYFVLAAIAIACAFCLGAVLFLDYRKPFQARGRGAVIIAGQKYYVTPLRSE